MILDSLTNADRYSSLHEVFAESFAFLRRADLASLADGRHDLLVDHLFAIIDRGEGRGRADSLIEFHRKYIDIQYVISGIDSIGWMALSDCQRISTPYDAEKDVGFYYDRPETWLSVPAGSFAVFYPEDAHAPLGGEGPIHKAVVKVAVR